jgi:UDP-N-acetylglucosamine 4,6-dehydratase
MKKLLIVGGSGTIARAFLSHYYNDYEFYCLARNERHLAEVKRDFPDVNIKIGNIEDKQQLYFIFDKIRPNIVVHMAAMKHVNLVEENPIQGSKINVQGSLNVISASLRSDVPITVGLSTDKACSPENVYGYSKSLLESCFIEANTDRNRFACTRFANVAMTSDSVVPLWETLIEQDKPLKLTDPNMNRLMFSQKEAVSVIKKSIDRCENYGGGFIASTLMKSVNMKDLAETLLEMYGKSKDNIEIVGIRPGEKIDEKLVSEKEIPFTHIHNDLIYIRQQENTGENKLEEEYSTKTAEKMTKDEIIKLCTR